MFHGFFIPIFAADSEKFKHRVYISMLKELKPKKYPGSACPQPGSLDNSLVESEMGVVFSLACGGKRGRGFDGINPRLAYCPPESGKEILTGYKRVKSNLVHFLVKTRDQAKRIILLLKEENNFFCVDSRKINFPKILLLSAPYCSMLLDSFSFLDYPPQ